jgi:hypothetical protein
MKKHILLFVLASFGLLTSCQDLDLNPLSQGSSENWYTNSEEITMALNALYDPAIWYVEANRMYNTDRWSDDWSQRTQLYDWLAGNISGDWSDSENTWAYTYKGIARANTVLYSLEKAKGSCSEAQLKQFEGEARFFRACFYSYLIFLYGDVPYYTEYITLDQAYNMGRTNKEVILDGIYKDFDIAAEYLPDSYTGVQRITKGAAYAFKARIALWMGDWAVCAKSAKDCMDLGVYSLEPDFAKLFLSSTKNSSEVILDLPKSTELGVVSSSTVKSYYSRTPGGNGVAQPSWELFFAFPCTDGLSVDKSPLYDPANPFKNRDPRLAMTCVEFGTPFLGYIYDPRPSASKVLQISTNAMVKNKDSKAVDQWASFDALCLKKGVDEEWTDDYFTDADVIIMRYADVLLMYAESKMELGQIDATVLNAINQVRARAYGVDVAATTSYPSVTEVNQVKLRKIIRNERRIELAWENRRWFDLIRWHWCDDLLTKPVYCLPTVAQMKANEASGYWIFPKNVRPTFDANGNPDVSAFVAAGYAAIAVQRAFVPRQYLFPIPSKEIMICSRLKQNPGY